MKNPFVLNTPGGDFSFDSMNMDCKGVQTRKGDRFKVWFYVNEEDFEIIKGSDLDRAHFRVTLERIDYDAPHKAEAKGGELAKGAAIMCKKPEFQKFIGASNEAEARAIMHKRLFIRSRAEIDTNRDAAIAYKKLIEGFNKEHKCVLAGRPE